jgi:Protein of unknown function (DUF3754)
MTTDTAAPLDKRGQFIAARKRDVFDALMGDLGLIQEQGDSPEKFYRLLTAFIHYEYLGDLEHLHDAYHQLNPEKLRGDLAPAVSDAAYATLLEALEHVLKGANFVEVTPEQLVRAGKETGRIRYPVRTGAADFRAIRLFRRGQHNEAIERRSWWGFRRRQLTIEVFDEVVLFAALKPAARETKKRRRKQLVAPGSVMIKAFHNIASADLDALFPNVRVVMTTTDKLTLGLPALLAGVPLLIKLIPAFFIVYGLLRFYAGAAPPDKDGMAEALIVATAILGVGGFMMNQWMKYERRSLRYQKEVNDTIYFHNVTNNEGIFDHIIGAAEEQEAKETLLAYFLLLTATEPMTEATLDAAIEAWLKHRFALQVDFEVSDALEKLERYGLLVRTDATLSVLPLHAALCELDRRWDGFFDFPESDGDHPPPAGAVDHANGMQTPVS